MSLRVRFAIWYAALTALLLVTIAGSVYVIHGRSLYADLDRTLVDDARLVAPLLSVLEGAPEPIQPPPLPIGSSFVRAYDADGQLLALETGVAGPPPISIQGTLAAEAGPAHDVVIRAVFRSNVGSRGAFATVRRGGDGPRVRVYALSVQGGGEVIGYVQSWASLQTVDQSIARFRWTLGGLVVVGVLLSAAGGAAVTHRVLLPLASVVATADEIAKRRDFDRRVPVPASRDEMADLSATLNEMLDALSEAHRAQQRFVADAAHELRAPLTAIRGNADLLARHEGMTDEDRRESIADLQSEARWLGRLVEELLVLARSDAGQPILRRPVTLADAVLMAVRDIAPAERDRVQIQEIAAIEVTGDRDRLRQLTTILLDNALRYSAPLPVVVRLEVDDAAATLRVSDQGPGIAPADLPHVFERFYRGDPARRRAPGGAGLGLAIARWIVDEHGGQIDIDSGAERGTQVTVTLPLARISGAPGIGSDKTG